VFERVRVLPRIAGGTRIEWTLKSALQDRSPYLFQLQVGKTGLHQADDWADVGLPATDTYYLLDDEQRVLGRTQYTHYRIVLTTTSAVYYSPPAHCFGLLDFRHWRLAHIR
jgi:hypothetical protein